MEHIKIKSVDFGYGIVLMSLVLLFIGCNNDAEYKRVDFDRKLQEGKQQDPQPNFQTLRVAVAAMISPKQTIVYYQELVDYLCGKLGYKFEMIQRKTYDEVSVMLGKGQIDLAFICTGPFVSSRETLGFEAIATPVVHGEPFYRSYLIVHRDSSFENLSDLQGHTFAFTDPASNSGSLVPRFWLDGIGARAETFFKSFTFTYSHDNSIMAVAKKLVDGAAVDGSIWEYYRQRDDFYTGKTRVIRKSEPFGSPPLVVSSALDPAVKSLLGKLALSMHEDVVGKRILSELMIDRFVAPEDSWYEPVRDISNRIRKIDENTPRQTQAEKP
jgi:phosphonate transport system substrate-binding protein